MSFKLLLNLKHHIDNLLTVFKVIKIQNIEDPFVTKMHKRFQEVFDSWENLLNSLTELNLVEELGAQIFGFNNKYKRTFSLRLETNKKRVGRLIKARQTTESINKSLKISDEKNQRVKRKEAQEFIEATQLEIRKLKKQIKRINTFLYLLQQNFIRFQQHLAEKIDTFRSGLSPERIQIFAHFTADESHVGDQCSICMEDFEIGRNMMRLDCDGKHAFCQVCIEG